MTVSARITLQGKSVNGDQVTLHFAPDYADGRNQEWAKYTPGLNLTMAVKPEISDLLDVDGKYTMLLMPTMAEPDPADDNLEG